MPPTIALATAAVARDLDVDLPPLRAALEAAGARVLVPDWDDPAFDWGACDLVVVRSPWDYSSRREELLGWAERVSAVAPLHNPASVLRWNTDKHYLAELAAAGVPVVPTTFLDPGDEIVLPDGEVVVKPVVSAGARDTERYAPERHDHAVAHAAALLAAGRGVMVQPYLAAVEQHGETALVHLDGRFSHALRKGPILVDGVGTVDGLYAEEDIRPREPASEELALAAQVLGAVPFPDPLLYARVDVVRDDDGAPRLLELEVAEPSLFVDHAPGAAERYAAAVLARLP